MEETTPEKWFDIREFRLREVLEERGDIPLDLYNAIACSDAYFLGTDTALDILTDQFHLILHQAKSETEALQVLARVMFRFRELSASALDVGLSKEVVDEFRERSRVEREFSKIVEGL